MSWDVIALLIIEVGFPAAMSIADKWMNSNPVTAAELKEVRDLANQSAADRMKLALVKAGIDPESDKGKALLALAG